MNEKPSSSLWDVVLAIIARLRSEFLLITTAYLLIVVGVAVFVPDVVTLLGRGLFYLIVVLALLAYIFARTLATYGRLRQQRDRYLRGLVDHCAHLQMTTIDIRAASPLSPPFPVIPAWSSWATPAPASPPWSTLSPSVWPVIG